MFPTNDARFLLKHKQKTDSLTPDSRQTQTLTDHTIDVTTTFSACLAIRVATV
jgi:hypothetical protein